MLKVTWIISPNPIKTVITKSLKQFKTLIKFHNLSLYSNVCNIKKCYILSVLKSWEFSTEIMSNLMQAKTYFEYYNFYIHRMYAVSFGAMMELINLSITVALDIRKDFDTINIHTIIRKLLQTNIPGTLIKFIANYIKGRKSYTT